MRRKVPPENLAAQSIRMNHCADVGVGEEIDDTILTRFEVNFDLGKRGDVGMRNAIPRVTVLGHGQQALAGERCGRCDSKFIDVLRQFVAVVDAPELDSALSRLCQTHSWTAALADDALVRNFVIVGLAAQIPCRDLLQLLPSVHGHRMRGARHRVSRLAAARRTSPGQVLR